MNISHTQVHGPAMHVRSTYSLQKLLASLVHYDPTQPVSVKWLTTMLFANVIMHAKYYKLLVVRKGHPRYP